MHRRFCKICKVARANNMIFIWKSLKKCGSFFSSSWEANVYFLCNGSTRVYVVLISMSGDFSSFVYLYLYLCICIFVFVRQRWVLIDKCPLFMLWTTEHRFIRQAGQSPNVYICVNHICIWLWSYLYIFVFVFLFLYNSADQY